jgi:hypothetical protein
MNSTESGSGGSRGRQRKDEAREILLARDFDRLDKWALGERTALRTLSSLLFDHDRLVCWRATGALGRIAAKENDRNPEKVRELLRRLFWQLNDESGNLGWYAPQAIAQILAHTPSYLGEYARVLVSFLPEEPFEVGVRWGLARIAAVNKKVFEDTVAGELLLRSLVEPDKDRLGFTLYALAALGIKVDPADIEPFKSDPHDLEIYNWETGEFESFTIARLAGELL